VFGLSPLEEIRAFNPSGDLNIENLAFVGASVGPLLSANDSRESGTRRKLLSGQHSTSCEEVKSQLYWPHQLLDVCALGGTKRPEYDSLSVAQFVAGFTASILVYLPHQLRGTVVENQLKHLNKLMSYTMVTDWSSILGFNAQLLHACENHQLSFSRWSSLAAWHERHLQSIRFMPQRGKKDGAGNNNNNGAGDTSGNGSNQPKNDPNFVPQAYIRSQHLCMKFQSGKCDEQENHIFGKVTLVHACALCAYKDRGSVVDHGSHNCPKKFKPKKSNF
jgi:hypothetical protein